MSNPPDDLHGSDLLLLELREEASRLVHHPVDELKRLEHVAEDGDSPTTPLLVTIGVTAVIAVIAAVMMAVELVVYYAG